MKEKKDNMEKRDKLEQLSRRKRLPRDLVITPVEELPPGMLEAIYPDGNYPEGYYGVQREKVRALPKIVAGDVVEVLRAFGEDGALYEDVLVHFVELRGLDYDELDRDMRKLFFSLLHASFLVDGEWGEDTSADAVTPSFGRGDTWLHYRIVENINCVVDSEIYRVEDEETGRPGALKITQDRFPNPDMKREIRRRLRHEFGVIEEIDHPNVIKVWEQGEHRQRVYGVLDWVEGPNVGTYAVRNRDALKDSDLVKLLLECGEALGAVHRAGYLHGDVHSGNFLLRDGGVCLLDFGLARPIDIPEGEEWKYPEGGVLMFTPPEYVRRKFEKTRGMTGSVAGEVYSFGVIMFALLTRRYPYQWKSYREEYMKVILKQPHLTFADCGREPWPPVERIIDRTLSKKKKDRYQSMDELLDNLKKIL